MESWDCTPRRSAASARQIPVTEQDGKETEHYSLTLQWRRLTTENVSEFRTLNSVLFPVRYSDRFYTEALGYPSDFVRLVYDGSALVAGVCARIEHHTEHDCDKLHIMTLGVLAPYRSCGIGTALLAHVERLVQNSMECVFVEEIYLHVQVGNDDALRFYTTHGFQIKEKLIAYYRRIQPADCFYVRKKVDNRARKNMMQAAVQSHTLT